MLFSFSRAPRNAADCPKHHVRVTVPASAVRVRLTAVAMTAVVATTIGACASKPEPLSVTLYGEARVGRAPASAFTNANGSSRILRASDLDAFYARVAPMLERDATDPHIQIDPNYTTALLIKESGLDSLAVSPAPALGLAQLTASADSDMRAMIQTPSFAWMVSEVTGWPRDSLVHAGPTRGGSADSVRARLARGVLTSRTEYLFDPVLSAKAAEFWIRLLQTKWTTDQYPGGYGTFASQKLAQGQAISPDQLFDLVTVSYNQGYVWTHGAVDRFGKEWVRHLPELGGQGVEAADYLARVRAYTVLLQRAVFGPTLPRSPRR